MIKGVHTMFYSSKPEELRAFLRDKLRFPYTDVRDGWLIFDLPEADMGCHPANAADGAPSGTHAILVGLGLELLKYVNLLVWPFLQKKLDREYSVFQHSVTILLWAFAVAMIVLAGAHWTARQDRPDPLS